MRIATKVSVLIITLLAVIACSGPKAPPETQQSVYAPYNGPKKTIAVTKFDAHGAFIAKYGDWDIGGGLASMLVSELNKTNRFIVLDRADLAAVLKEHEMLKEGATISTALKAG